MKLRSEKGFTGIEIAVSVVIIFIFVSVIAILNYRISSAAKEIELKSDATYLAINEIESVKSDNFSKYNNRSEKNGNSIIVNNEEIKDGYYKTISVIDYTDLPGNENKTENIVKKVTVKVSYMFKAKEQTVELSTVVTKEN